MKVSADAAGQRLDKFLRRALKDVPLSHIFKLLRTRKVRVNGGRGKAEQVLAEGDAVVVRADEERLLGRAGGEAEPAPGAVKVTFSVLFEDEHLLAVNKPAGLAAHPGTGITGATLVEEARTYLRVPADLPSTEFKPSPAHRLDRETSGVVLVAKTRRCMVALTGIFTEGEGVRKSYLALAKGKMPRTDGTVDLPLTEHEQTARSKTQRGVKFQEAVTHYRVVSSMRDAALVAAVLAWRHYAGGLPDVPTLAEYRPPIVTELVSSDGQLAGELFDERRKVVPFERIPTKLVQALLASEDKNFFEHGGIDWAGTLRAAVNTYVLRHKVQGGSTITQQTAKSLLVSAEGFEQGTKRNLRRKVRELILARRLEVVFSKQEILWLYLNGVFLGHHSYGVQAAAENYFRKNVEDLTLAEVALLAGLPQAPSKYSPFSHPDAAKDRRRYVLRRMFEEKMISKEERDQA